MNLLIDIGHPAHVHIFRHFALEMMKNGHNILFTVRDKENNIKLLEAFKFKYIVIGEAQKKLFKKIIWMLYFDYKLIKIAKKFNADLILSHGSMYAAQCAFFIRKPHICFEDTGNFEQIVLYKYFTKYILTPSVLPNIFGEKQIYFNGYNEITYLHPNYYKPNAGVYELLNIKKTDKYALIRFTSGYASHDKLNKSICYELQIRIINHLKKYGLKIFVSSEKEMPEQIRKYKLCISPEKIFDVMYYSEIVVGDSQTMIAEAGILGTPSIRFNALVGKNHGYHHAELEKKYGLIYNYHLSQESDFFNKVDEILLNNNSKNAFREKSRILINEKEDVNLFLLNFINEKYIKHEYK